MSRERTGSFLQPLQRGQFPAVLNYEQVQVGGSCRTDRLIYRLPEEWRLVNAMHGIHLLTRVKRTTG